MRILYRQLRIGVLKIQDIGGRHLWMAPIGRDGGGRLEYRRSICEWSGALSVSATVESPPIVRPFERL